MTVFLFHTCIAMALGFVLDLILGDPETWPHPVRFIGKLISGLERLLYPAEGPDEKKFWNGFMLAAAASFICTLLPYLCLRGAYALGFGPGLFLETVMCWQIPAVKSLRTASVKVYNALTEEGLSAGRRAVSMIVGRDTERLSEEGVIKAAVETVAESTSDGITAPLFWVMLGGPALGWFYKSVNTMDSMIGYRNDRYLFFGRAAARMDDVLNFLPSRISACFMILAACFTGFDGKAAYRIWKRDRRNHKSPNSAQTESVCAGALHLKLAGSAYYFGKLVEKPYIGDDRKKPEPEDILRANRLMTGTAVLSILTAVLGRAVLTYLLLRASGV